jgi:hypothetical protein
MNRLLLAFGALLASALLIPGDAEAQRGGRGGGGARMSGGFGGGGGSFRGGGGFGGGSRMYVPRGGVGGSRVGMGGYRGRAVAARPGGYRQAAISNPGGRYGYRPGYGRYGYRTAGYYGGRYPYYGRNYGRYPYYGGWGAGLVTGSIVGAASTYPYYNNPYSTYQTPVSSAVGGYCATSVRTCALTNAAPVGIGCSCRTQGGRARGTVVGSN